MSNHIPSEARFLLSKWEKLQVGRFFEKLENGDISISIKIRPVPYVDTIIPA